MRGRRVLKAYSSISAGRPRALPESGLLDNNLPPPPPSGLAALIPSTPLTHPTGPARDFVHRLPPRTEGAGGRAGALSTGGSGTCLPRGLRVARFVWTDS